MYTKRFEELNQNYHNLIHLPALNISISCFSLLKTTTKKNQKVMLLYAFSLRLSIWYLKDTVILVWLKEPFNQFYFKKIKLFSEKWHYLPLFTYRTIVWIIDATFYICSSFLMVFHRTLERHFLVSIKCNSTTPGLIFFFERVEFKSLAFSICQPKFHKFFLLSFLWFLFSG